MRLDAEQAAGLVNADGADLRWLLGRVAELEAENTSARRIVDTQAAMLLAATNRRDEALERLAAVTAERDEALDIAEINGTLVANIRTMPCRCDPPGSGEEFCTGHCEIRAERDAARAETAAQFEAMQWAASIRALDEAAPLTDDERARLPTAEALFPHAAAFLAENRALRERVAAWVAARRAYELLPGTYLSSGTDAHHEAARLYQAVLAAEADLVALGAGAADGAAGGGQDAL